jgi:cellulose synthase (UDP-forming)
MADLSDTAVILPSRPGPVELSAFLGLMGTIGSLTGYPVLRLTVARTDGLDDVADKDLIIMGTLSNLGRAADLLRSSPVRLEGSRLVVTLSPSLATVRRLFGDHTIAERERLATALTAAPGDGTAMLVGTPSPLHSGRSLVAFLAVTPLGLTGLVDSMRDGALAPSIQGDFALLAGNRITSYQAQPTYNVGTLPVWLWPEWLLRDRPLFMVVLLAVGCVMVSVGAYWSLRRVSAARLRQGRRSA